MNNLIIEIKKHNGINVVSSRIIAEQLGKQHSHVMSKIKEVLGVAEFCESSYMNSQGKIQPEFLLTRDGFILLCMNYTGYNDFKRAYINKFNEMEKELKNPHTTQFQRLYERSPQELLSDNAIALNKMFEVMKLNIPKEIIVSTAIHETKNSIGYDFPEVQKLLTKQEEESYHTKSEICKKVGIKANKVNDSLIELDIQKKGSSTLQPYILTENGKQYGVERVYTTNGHQGYEIKLKSNSEEYLKKNLNKLPIDWLKKSKEVK
ncbi:MAG: Rha family transcriptional regulator [Methanobacteriaceae archaeon]